MSKYIGEKFRIPYPQQASERKKWNKQYGMNSYYSGKHWAARKQDADFWHWLTKQKMDEQNVRRTPFKKPVILTFYFNDRMDCSNHGVLIKMIEDGMKGRLITDDSRQFVNGIECYFHDENYILIEIREA